MTAGTRVKDTDCLCTVDNELIWSMGSSLKTLVDWTKTGEPVSSNCKIPD